MRKNLIGCLVPVVAAFLPRISGLRRRWARAATRGRGPPSLVFVASLSRGLSEPPLAAARRACEACGKPEWRARARRQKRKSAAKFRAACCPIDQPHTAVYT